MIEISNLRKHAKGDAVRLEARIKFLDMTSPYPEKTIYFDSVMACHASQTGLAYLRRGLEKTLSQRQVVRAKNFLRFLRRTHAC